MNIGKARRMAGQILKVGEGKVWFDPEQIEQISESMTKEDIRGLVASKAIRASKSPAHSRGRARVLKKKKKAGRKRGYGKRKGRKKARTRKKDAWINTVRAQRKKLAALKQSGSRLSISHGKTYKMIKGGYFKGKKYLDALVKEGKK